jgi:alkylated DNA repair dioxygenase AlkB
MKIIADAEVSYLANFVTASDSLDWMRKLRSELQWESHVVKIFGRDIPAPRLSSWIGDAHCSYRYSGVRYQPKAWPECLRALRARLHAENFGNFNCLLANYYRSGADSMGWHSDNEAELGPQPLIASLSLGAARRFCLRHKLTGQKHELLLENGSLLIMQGNSQRDWQHALPKAAKVGSPRINLTFRYIAPFEGT